MACSAYLILSLFLVSSFVIPLVDGSGTGELAHLFRESKHYHLPETFSSFPAQFCFIPKHIFLQGKHIHRKENGMISSLSSIKKNNIKVMTDIPPYFPT